MCEPRYRDLRASEVPSVHLDDDKVFVKVISGKVGDVDSVKDLSYTPVWYLDVEIQPGGILVQTLPKDWNAFAFVFEGSADFTSPSGALTRVDQHGTVLYKPGGAAVSIQVTESQGFSARLLLIAGQILDQTIVQHGPFVLTSSDGIRQAFEDFCEGKNGFERAKG
ncbi:pirin (iron-binding nuclear) [Fusarium napiforme]|uniref:Pirin (Iron-binding nuclear) n=1 Tax=Fusarium napiforme TaxID=42672 RepID=A0A8H5JQK6_9HYPO|nr:pirin (iron-binding nuclear) [Fusarium napiforme]